MKDTIVAIATPPGKGGVGIVRISGENASLIAQRFFSSAGDTLEHGKMYFGKFKGSVEDSGYLVLFKSPKSYTGEDVLEIHLHGSPYILRSVVSDVVQSGLARLAEPGEFTKRALFNGKINLVEAEAVNTIISAENSYQAKVLSSLSGRLSVFLSELKSDLVNAIAFIEATIEYPEEEETEDALNKVEPVIKNALEKIQSVLDVYKKTRFLFKGAKIVIAGKPNVGKSSLLNAIAGYERAIVTDIPGTTTDSIEVEIDYKGIKFSFVDTAGIRAGRDKIENLGIERTFKELEEADLILYVFDIDEKSFELPDNLNQFQNKILKVLNKTDLKKRPDYRGMQISALKKDGIDFLLEEIYSRFADIDFSENFIFSDRQFFALNEARDILQNLLIHIEEEFLPEIGVSYLNHAIEVLQGVVGEITTDDILDSVFGNFCLGK